ncbi:MAG: hypothetical protein ACOYN3_00915, partial [Acidimicrobiia bacterium]
MTRFRLPASSRAAFAGLFVALVALAGCTVPWDGSSPSQWAPGPSSSSDTLTWDWHSVTAQSCSTNPTNFGTFVRYTTSCVWQEQQDWVRTTSSVSYNYMVTH